MTISVFNSEAFCGYTQKTTFWQDFSIADAFGLGAVLSRIHTRERLRHGRTTQNTLQSL